MIRFSPKSARLAFSKDDYPRESLEAAAAVLPPDVQVFLESAAREHRVELRLARPAAARLRALAGAFADAALNHAYRQRVVRFHGGLTGAVLARLLERGFKPVPADPLEELEPQVRLDHAKDLESLLAEAKRMGGSVSRLTVLPGLPPADPVRVGPHSYRRLAGRVLLANDWGGRAMLSEDEYRRYLAGLDEKDPLWAGLQAKGFVRNALDFDSAAAALAERGLAAWRGPSSHSLWLERGGKVMSLDAARACVDFAFSAPGPQVTIELVAYDADARWPVVWFAVQYARRRAEWARRPLFLILRARGGLSAERVEFLRGHGVTRRLALDLAGTPDLSAAPAFPAQRALCSVAPGARDPAGWADLLSGWGLDSARIQPARDSLAKGGVPAFLAFYAAFLGRLVERAEEHGPAEEWALAFLNRMAWNVPGVDILETLAYSPDGGVHTSEEGLTLAEGEWPAFRLGEAGRLRYEDIAANAAARACLTAVVPDNQPLCSQCVYKSCCTVPPSAGMALQGTVWGDMVSSPACALHMGILDILFARLDEEKMALLLGKWGIAA